MDGKDVAGYGRFLAGDVEMHFNNDFFGKGKEALLGDWKSIGKLSKAWSTIC